MSSLKSASPPPTLGLVARVQLAAFGLFFGAIAFLPIHPRFLYLMTGDWTLLAIPMVVLLLLLLFLGRGTWRLLLDRSDWPVWLLAAALAAGLVNATNQTLALRVYGHMVLVLVVFFYAGKIFMSEPGHWRGICLTIASLSAVVALYGLLENAFGVNLLYEGLLDNPYYERYRLQNRPLSTQFNPAPLATFLLLSWPFAAFLVRKPDRLPRKLGYVSVVLVLSCLFITFSRGALLGLIVVIALGMILRKRFKELRLAILVVAVMIGIATLLPYPANKYGIRGFFGVTGAMSSSKELIAIRMTGRMLRDHPWVGIGHVGFRLSFDEYYPEDAPPLHFNHADNAYLTLAAENGLTSVLALLIFSAFLLRRALLAYRAADGAHRAMAEATLLALIGLTCNALGYNLFSWTAPWMYSCLLFGFVAGLEKQGRAPSVSSLPD